MPYRSDLEPPSIRRYHDEVHSASAPTYDSDHVFAPPARLGLSRSDFDELVDEVVERIEQRVVDELDRRGRRAPGAF